MDADHGNNTPTQKDNNQVDLLSHALVVIKWRSFIVKAVSAVTILAVVISLLLPKWYKASVSLLPPRESGLLSLIGAVGSSSSVSSLIRNLPLGARGSLGGNLGSYNYLAILNSRTAMEAVVRRFNLTRVYDISDSSMEKAIKELEGNVEFEVQEQDYITIDLWDKDPVRSAEMANYFVEQLNEISNRLGTEEGKNNREFIERRLAKAREELHDAEESLKTYQEQTGILVSPDKDNSSIAAVAELYVQKAKKEVEIGVLERTVSKDNPLLQQTKVELSEINKKVDQIPEVGMGALRLYREVVVQQRIIEFLVPLYEQAKVDEQKDLPVILVLDKAVPPEKKDRPKRLLIVVSAFLSSLLLSIAFIFVRERFLLLKQEKPIEYETLRNVFRRRHVEQR